MPKAPEIPITAGCSEVSVTAENTCIGWHIRPSRIFHVNMKYLFCENGDKLYIINTLVSKMRGIEIKPEAWMVFNCLKCPVSGSNVKGNFCRMSFKCKAYSKFLVFVKYWYPSGSKIIITFINHSLGNRWKRVEKRPYRASGESCYSIDSKPLRRFSRFDHFISSSLTDTLRVPIAPYITWYYTHVPFINPVTYSLADKMIGYCEDF